MVSYPLCRTGVGGIMAEKEVLLIAGNYPHVLMQHMNTLVREKGRSILWEDSFVRLFEDRFPEFGQEFYILNEAYGLKIPERFQKADRQAVWAKRVCITQSLFVLVQKMKEYEAVMLVESFLCLLEWNIQVSVERKWEAAEEDRAHFHEAEYRKASGQIDLERRAREQLQKTGQRESGSNAPAQRTIKQGNSNEPIMSGQASDLSGFSSGDAQEAGSVDRDYGTQKTGGTVPAEGTGQEKNTPLPEENEESAASRAVKFMEQMNLSMRREVKRAKKGNADSQQKLGGFYSEEGTNHLDYKEAVYWYRLSAGQGNYKSQMELGRIFDSGKLEDADSKTQGIYWYHKLAEEGFPTAQCILGAKYLWGDGVEENRREAVYWFKKAAAQGHEEAKGYLSGLL